MIIFAGWLVCLIPNQSNRTSILTWRLGPLLLGCSVTRDDGETAAQSWRDLPKHKDEDQVKLDVNRSFIYYPSSRSDSLSVSMAQLADGMQTNQRSSLTVGKMSYPMSSPRYYADILCYATFRVSMISYKSSCWS